MVPLVPTMDTYNGIQYLRGALPGGTKTSSEIRKIQSMDLQSQMEAHLHESLRVQRYNA